MIRWIVIFLSANCTSKTSSRKVYFRYLLLNGRHLYSNLFGSQQNWMLFIQQFSLITMQMALTMILTVKPVSTNCSEKRSEANCERRSEAKAKNEKRSTPL